MSRTRAALWALLALMALRIPAALVMNALLPDAAEAPLAFYLATIAQELVMFGLPALLLRPWRSERMQAARRSWRWLAVAAAAALMARAALTPLTDWWVALTEAEEALLPQPGSVWETVLQVLALAIVPALAEEAFFRGALLTALMDGCRRSTASLLSTLMFSLMHGSLAGLPAHMSIGFVLTLLMLRSGRIIVPVTAHALYNALALCWPVLPGRVGAVCGVLLAILVCAMFPLLQRERPRMGRVDALLAFLSLAGMTAFYLL